MVYFQESLCLCENFSKDSKKNADGIAYGNKKEFSLSQKMFCSYEMLFFFFSCPLPQLSLEFQMA